MYILLTILSFKLALTVIFFKKKLKKIKEPLHLKALSKINFFLKKKKEKLNFDKLKLYTLLTLIFLKNLLTLILKIQDLKYDYLMVISYL